MKNLLDEMDPLFMGAAVMIAGLNLAASSPNPPMLLKHPQLDFSSPEEVQKVQPTKADLDSPDSGTP